MGIFGRVETFEQLVPKAKVFGVRLDNLQSAVSLEYLETNGHAILPIGPDKIIIAYDKSSQTVNGFLLAKSDQSAITDLSVIYSRITTKDGSLSWEASSGKLLKGEGKDLEPVPVISSFWFAWASFFPNSDLIK